MKLFYSFAFILLLPAAVFSRNIYIVYDSNCMDRLEYGYATEDGEANYSVYHINLNYNEKIILEVGRESEKIQKYIPSNFWRCDNANFNLELIQSINQNQDDIFLVHRKGRKKYTISRVRIASYYKLENEIVQYFSPKYRFEFDLQAGIIGENIAFEDPRSEVYFEGRLDNECSGAYIFRQYSEARNNPPHTDIVLVPEVGVIEERSGKNVDDAFDNLLHLQKINGTDINRYLKRLCGNGEIEEDEDDSVADAENDPQPGGQDYDQPTTPVEDEFTEKTVDPGNGEPTTDQHIVKKGETLYKIARKYDVSVAQLQTWNNKTGSSIIYPGDVLWVNSPDLVALNERGGDKNPAPYEEDPFTSRGNNLDDRINLQESGNYHQVKVGETVASIAMRYGYTEEKFREINNMGPRQIVRIGQRVRTSDCNCPENTGTRSVTHPESQQGQSPNGYNYFRDSPPPKTNRFNYVNSRKETTPVNKNIPTFYDAPSDRFDQLDDQAKGGSAYYENVSTPQNYGEVPISYEITPPNSRKVHVVGEGETIFTVARKYRLSVEKIRDLNNLEKHEVVIPFQRLYVE